MPKVNTVYKWSGHPRLPRAYQEVEYIQSTGTQRIDTWINVSNDTTYWYKICVSEVTTQYWAKSLMDMWWNSTDENRYWISYGWLLDNWQFWYTRTSSPYWWASVSWYWPGTRWTETHILEYNPDWNRTWVIDWTTVVSNMEMSNRSYTSNWNVFCQVYWTTFTRYWEYKLWYLKIYHWSTLVRDFVPCYRKSDSVIGLYDLVNDTFYTNAGTWTFTKWEDVNVEIQIYPPNPTPVSASFSYTWADQHWTIPKTWTYLITAKWAWGRSAKWWLASWKFQLTQWTELSIMVWANWGNWNWTKYWFGWSANGWSNAAWWWLSWVFTWSWTITSSDSARVLVIWWWAWGNSAWTWWAWWGTTWWTGTWSYWTAWAWGTQTWRWSWWNTWSWQFQWWNWSWTYGYWGWGWWRWGNGSIWDSSADDDKWGWGWSWYVASSGTDAVLTQWWWANAWSNWSVTIEKI